MGHPGEVVLFSYVRSLVEALPFIPLFIAMGLLVCGWGGDTGVEAPANPLEQATANADSLRERQTRTGNDKSKYRGLSAAAQRRASGRDDEEYRWKWECGFGILHPTHER
jgi:hypothetical protein